MKKYLKKLFIMVIFLVIPLSVFAKTEILGTEIVDITVPENWRLFTNENLDEMMTWLNFNDTQKNTYKYNWSMNSYFFDLISETKNAEIILIKKFSNFKIDDLSIYQDETINESFDSIKKEYEVYNPNVSIFTTTNGVKYYKIEYKDNNYNLNLIDYITIIHGNIYEYKLQSSSELTSEIINTVEKTLNSIEYDGYLEFIENNKIDIDKKKSSNSSVIIIIVILILIVGGGIAIYLTLNKKKKNTNSNVQPQIYNPVQGQAPINTAVSDFLNQNPQQPESPQQPVMQQPTNPSVTDFNKDNNQNNNQ